MCYYYPPNQEYYIYFTCEKKNFQNCIFKVIWFKKLSLNSGIFRNPGGLLYISTSVWVLRTPNAGRNRLFQHFCMPALCAQVLNSPGGYTPGPDGPHGQGSDGLKNMFLAYGPVLPCITLYGLIALGHVPRLTKPLRLFQNQ